MVLHPYFAVCAPGPCIRGFGQNRGHYYDYYGIYTGSVLRYKQQMVPVVYCSNQYNCTIEQVIVPAWESTGGVNFMALLQTAV